MRTEFKRHDFWHTYFLDSYTMTLFLRASSSCHSCGTTRTNVFSFWCVEHPQLMNIFRFMRLRPGPSTIQCIPNVTFARGGEKEPLLPPASIIRVPTSTTQRTRGTCRRFTGCGGFCCIFFAVAATRWCKGLTVAERVGRTAVRF